MKLQSDEKIIKEGGANHFKGVESVGGKLYLTNKRVFFKSHKFNIQTHELSIPYNQIKSTGKRNSLGIVPNGMFIELNNGEKEKFVIWGRTKWIEEINKLKT